MTENPVDASGEMPEQTESEVSDSLEPAMLAAIKDAVLQSTQGIQKSMNHELAGLRRKLKKSHASDVSEEAQPEPPAGAAMGADDVRAYIEVGKLQAQVDEATADTLQGLNLSATQEAAILKAIIGASNQPARKGRDAREIKRNATSAARNSAAQPQSQVEFFNLRKTDPKRYKALQEDPAFFPEDLPMRA